MTIEFEPKNFCDGVYYSPEGVKRKADGLSVRLTSFCSNACDFCIASEDMKNHRRKDIPKLIEETIKSGATGVQVLGGEPMLFLDDCIEYVEGVKDHLNFFYFTTALAVTIDRQWDKFVHLMRMTPALTVSMQSTDWEENNRILVSKDNLNRMEQLERIVNFEDFGDKVTVQLNLVKGGLDSAEKVWNALDDLNDIGVKSVRINELQAAGDVYVNFEEIMGMSLKSPYAHGCKTMLNLYPGMRVLLKRSCFMVEDSLYASEDDVNKMIDKVNRPDVYAWQARNVIYEDGSMSEYWENFRDDNNSNNKNKDNNLVSLGMPKIRNREEWV